MTEASEEMKAMARRVADEVSPRANPKDVLEAALNGAAYRGALAAIIETQEACASVADQLAQSTQLVGGLQDWSLSFGERQMCSNVATRIRTGNHYGKDESHD